MNKILITGSTGFIGRALVDNLLNEKRTIFAIIRDSKKNKNLALKIKKKNKQYFPIFFKKNDELVKKISKINPNVVVNLATNYIPFPKQHEISSVINSNIVFPTIILDICSKKKISKFINLCSIMQLNKGKIDNPENYYALTKILFKQTMTFYNEIYHNKIFLNLYIGDTFGSNDNRRKILPEIIKNYKKNKKTTVFTKKLKLNILHVNDVINGIKLLIKKSKKSENYLIKSKRQIDLFNIIKKFNFKSKKKIKLIWLNKKVNKINKVNIKSIPGWKEKRNVINDFYNLLK